MYAWCRVIGPDGKPVDPNGMCRDFRTPPLEAIANFEAHLPRLLAAHGFDDVARSLETYVRQYWAVFRDGRLHIVGNFVCRSSLKEAHLDEPHDDLGSVPESHIAHVPIVIDDAGRCLVTASFPAERPDEVQFQLSSSGPAPPRSAEVVAVTLRARPPMIDGGVELDQPERLAAVSKGRTRGYRGAARPPLGGDSGLWVEQSWQRRCAHGWDRGAS
jgi:hypothetical protein